MQNSQDKSKNTSSLSNITILIISSLVVGVIIIIVLIICLVKSCKNKNNGMQYEIDQLDSNIPLM